MAKKREKRGGKKGVSLIKKQMKLKNRMCKSGAMSKERRKLARKDRRKDKRKEEQEKIKSQITKSKNRYQETCDLSEDTMETMSEDVLETLGTSGKKRKREFDEVEDDDEEVRVKKLLPVKGNEGWVKRELILPKKQTALTLDKYKRKVRGQSEEEGDSGVGEEVDELKEEEEKSVKEPTEVQIKSVAEIMANRNRILQEKKVSIGCLAMNIIEDPNEKMNNFKSLLHMMNEEDPAVAVTIRKYASLTIVNVLHNIIPSYKIQEENIKNNKMKKVNYQVAQKEIELLTLYKKYLKSLEQFLEELETQPDNFGVQSICQTAVKCLGELVVQHPHFNYTINILQLLIPYLNCKVREIRQITFEAIKQTLKGDKVKYLTLEIVKRINKLVRAKKFKVKPEVLNVFLHIRISDMKNTDEESDATRSNMRQATHKEKLLKKLAREAMAKPSHKQRKERKKMAKLREQKAEFEATELLTVVNRKHSDVLAIIFGLYFHVLKNKSNTKLIGLVLEGLAKFAHLINIEFFSDLMRVLVEYLERGTLSQTESLHCIKTVFTILFGQGEALNIDPHRFYKQLYSKTFDMELSGKNGQIVTYLGLLHQALTLQRKKVSVTKVLAFTKRLATLALTLFHQEGIPVLVSLRSLLVAFSCTEALLDPNEDGCSGIFCPEVQDPEHSHPAATALWELHKLVCHYHPVVQDLSKNILSGTTFKEGSSLVHITKRGAEELYNDFDLGKLKFKPSIVPPDPHIKAHQNFLASRQKKKSVGDELSFENFDLQMRCEEILDTTEKEATSVLYGGEYGLYDGIMVNGVPYISSKGRKKKSGGKQFDVYGSLIQNIS